MPDQQQVRLGGSEEPQEGSEAGVKGTPAFFVNGVFISGAQPFEKFKIGPSRPRGNNARQPLDKPSAADPPWAPFFGAVTEKRWQFVFRSDNVARRYRFSRSDMADKPSSDSPEKASGSTSTRRWLRPQSPVRRSILMRSTRSWVNLKVPPQRR